MRTDLPAFHEHEDDSLIPVGYGIDESHDGGFYPYHLREDGYPIYMTDADGYDIRYLDYEKAREHLAEVAD